MGRLVDHVRAAAFDLDGTLVDTAPDLAAAANAMLDDLGYAKLPQDRIETMIGAGVDRLVERALAESTGAPPSDAMLATATHRAREHYAEHLFEKSRVYPGVIEGLRALAASGIGLCVVTNKPSTFTRPLLAAAGLANLFAVVLCADRPEDRKPSPKLPNAALAHFGVRPDEMIYIGDSFVDVAVARAARCPVALVDYGYNEGRPAAEAKPDWLIRSVADVVALPAL